MKKQYIIDFYQINEEIYENYYYTFVILHRLYGSLKNKGNHDKIKENFKIVKKTFNKKVLVLSLIFNFISKLKFKVKSPTNLVDISNRFKYFKKNVLKESKEKGFNVISLRSNSNIVEPLYKLRLLIVSKKIVNLVDCLTPDNFESLLFDQNYLIAFENELKKIINKTNQYLIQRNIKSIFMGDYINYRRMIISFSAKKSNIPVFSIVHGYPAVKSALFYRASLFNDYVLAWDDEMSNFLKKFHHNSRVIQFGYPTIDFLKLNSFKYNTINKRLLYAINGLAEIDIVNQVLEELIKIQKNGWDVLIRIHPRQHDYKKLVRNIKQKKFKISKNNIYSDILKSEVVVGYNTSFLFDADIMGKTCFQLDVASKIVDYPHLKNIQISEINELEKFDLTQEKSKTHTLLPNLQNEIKKLFELQ